MDLVQTGEAVETEKDDLLEKVECVYMQYTCCHVVHRPDSCHYAVHGVCERRLQQSD